MFSFKILHNDKRSKARVGIVQTPHGSFSTPAFLPVGTQAAVKGLSPEEVLKTGTEIVLSNTYHLYLRPGANTIKKLGGIHKFMNWSGPILTDSAGFQVFSLGFGIEHEVGKMVSLYGDKLILGEEEKALVVRTKLCKIEEEGPTFVSHLDGSVHFFPPEKSIETQINLGADIIVALDECTSPLHNYDYTKAAMERTHRWEKRSLDYFTRSHRLRGGAAISDAGFGGFEGGPFEDLRIESTKFVAKNQFFGIGIGGALVNKQKMREILEWIHPYLPDDRPRHLFGIGTIDDIFEAVQRGVDMFDCVSPTRLGRMGHVFLKEAKVGNKFRFDITKSLYLNDSKPIDSKCGCYSCLNFSRAYISHLFRTHELLAYRLASIHNIFFMQKLMSEIREAIQNDQFLKLKQNWL